MTETVEVDRQTYEKIAARAAYHGLDLDELLALENENMDPTTVPELEDWLAKCPECGSWTRPVECWRCGVNV